MKLYNATLRPARVLEILEKGKIKVEAPGLFSRQDLENLPPVLPWFTGGTNAYSSINVGELVWILSVDDNPSQLYWFRKDDPEDNEDLSGLQNVEVLCNKTAGFGQAQLYFSDGTGWVIKNGETQFKITAEGDLELSAGGNQISVGSGGVKLGEETTGHPAYAEQVMDALCSIASCLDTIKKAALPIYFTMPIANAIGGYPDLLRDIAHDVLCKNVELP